MMQKWFEDDKLWEMFYDCMFDTASFDCAQQQVSEVLALVRHDVDTILDLGCGPGRHCIGFAKMNFKVTGIDTSNYLLARAQENSRGFNINYIREDMMSFENRSSYDLIVNMFNSFGYFDSHSDNQQVINKAFANLKETGTFIIDTVGKETLARTIEPVHLTEYENGDLRIERPLLIDNMQVFSNEWVLIRGDKAFKRRYQHYVYTPVELRAMCKKAGFSHVRCYGSLSADDYDLESDRLVIVAEK